MHVDRLGRHVHAALLQIAAKIVERISPRIALVRYIRLHQRQGDCDAVGVEIFERARQRYAVGKLRDFRQESPDLEFRIAPAVKPPIALDEQALAERYQRVAALCLLPADRQLLEAFAGERPERGSRPEPQLAM